MTSETKTIDLNAFIRDIPDFPKEGIVFKDITPLLKDPVAFKAAVDRMVEKYAGTGIDYVAGIESRGFLFAAALGYRLDTGVIPVRKKGKLPYKTHSLTYDLEYGTDTVEIHEDAVEEGKKVLLVDDLLATGGTALAAARLIEKTGAKLAGTCFLIELEFLKGREKLGGREVFSLLKY